jgi:hypothetical protein
VRPTPRIKELAMAERRFVGAALIGLLVIAGACGGDDGDAQADDGTTTTSTTDAADETTTTAASSSDDTSPGETNPAPGAGTTPSEPSGPPPTITSFTTPDSIDCHNGNDQAFTATWATANAAEVTISIDGGGVYDEYPPTGETSLPFHCASAHTFVLTAISADGQTATRSVVLQPRNAQPPANADQDQ